jgi:hypothetical protein
MISIRVTSDLYDLLARLAGDERRTLSNLALLLIERGFGERRAIGDEAWPRQISE